MSASHSSSVRQEVEAFMHGLEKRNPGEHKFHQAVREVTESLMPFILDHPKYKDAQILERLTEPDRKSLVMACTQTFQEVTESGTLNSKVTEPSAFASRCGSQNAVSLKSLRISTGAPAAVPGSRSIGFSGEMRS